MSMYEKWQSSNAENQIEKIKRKRNEKLKP